jgi:hypothetical protein
VKAASGTHVDLAAVLLDIPTVSGSGATITNFSALKILGAPTGATNNYAVWVDAGLTRLDGDVRVDSRVYETPTAITIADNAIGASPAAYTLDPVAAFVRITCNDADGATVTMGETNALDGMHLRIVNMGANVLNFADTAGVSELTGAIALGQYDTMELWYASDRWTEIATSNN